MPKRDYLLPHIALVKPVGCPVCNGFSFNDNDKVQLCNGCGNVTLVRIEPNTTPDSMPQSPHGCRWIVANGALVLTRIP